MQLLTSFNLTPFPLAVPASRVAADHQTKGGRPKKVTRGRSKSQPPEEDLIAKKDRKREVHRQNIAFSRRTETPQRRASRLKAVKEQIAISRNIENLQQRVIRLQYAKEKMAISREAETPEHRESRRESVRRNGATSRKFKTLDEIQTRRDIEKIRIDTKRKATWDSKDNSAYSYNPAIAYDTDSSVTIGSMIYACTFCKALKWNDESAGLCCGNGKIALESIKEPSEPLLSLLRSNDAQSKHFLISTCAYNSAFQMTSFGSDKRLNI